MVALGANPISILIVAQEVAKIHAAFIRISTLLSGVVKVVLHINTIPELNAFAF